MVSVCLSAVYLGPELRLGQTIKTTCIKIGLCYFSAKHVELGSKIKDWMAGYRNNVTD